QATYPAIDFAARLDWWRERWRTELVPNATVIVAESTGTLVGFVTLNPANGDLDQIVVAPEAWGGGVAERLLNEGKRRAPSGVELRVNADNIRAIRFYRKHGFTVVRDDVNPRSGAAVHVMRWQP